MNKKDKPKRRISVGFLTPNGMDKNTIYVQIGMDKSSILCSSSFYD